jgi:hypothetical protein
MTKTRAQIVGEHAALFEQRMHEHRLIILAVPADEEHGGGWVVQLRERPGHPVVATGDAPNLSLALWLAARKVPGLTDGIVPPATEAP